MKKGKTIGILFIIISIVELIRIYWPIILIWVGVDKLLSKPIEKES